MQPAQTASPPPQAAPQKNGIGCLKIGLAIFVVFVILGVIGSMLPKPPAGSKGDGSNAMAASEGSGVSASVNAVTSSEMPESAPSIGLFGPQANAARSAKQYLDMTGFSRRGLIAQLSSKAGNGYDVADATVAVDSLNVDWNEQAVRSAKQYLELTGFSCSGLINQLSSDAGSKYTAAEARYGAEQAGAC